MTVSKNSHPGLGSVGACAGPISLLLLPKCPLCVLPLFALLGLSMPPSGGLWIAAAVILSAWLGILLVVARRHPGVIAAACCGAATSAVAIALRNSPLLWISALAMTAIGVAFACTCMHQVDASSLDTPLGEA